MASVDDVQVNSATDLSGNSYTTAISNDKLTNEDFMKLLLEELRMQDPTKPQDTQAMMDSQLKMSQINANNEMVASLESLSNAFQASALSGAVGFMGKVIEDGSYDEELGFNKSYIVDNVESKDGTIYVNAREQVGFYHSILDGDNDKVALTYNTTTGIIYDTDGNALDVSVKINDDGSFETNSNGQVVLYDEDGAVIDDEDILNRYYFSDALPAYSTTSTLIDSSNITKVYG
jgi:flagellar basal-body rod modification protein FlgD